MLFARLQRLNDGNHVQKPPRHYHFLWQFDIAKAKELTLCTWRCLARLLALDGKHTVHFHVCYLVQSKFEPPSRMLCRGWAANRPDCASPDGPVLLQHDRNVQVEEGLNLKP